MIRSLLAASLLLSVAAAPALAGDDLVYRYRQAEEIGPLKGYDGQPYWRILAECSGVHGVLANRYEAAGLTREAEGAKNRGVALLRMALRQLNTDRGLAQPEALALASAAVDAGRDQGSQLLQRPAASGYSHEQLIDVMCTQVSDRHAKAVRYQR